MAATAVVLFALLLLPTGAEVEDGRLYPVEVRFGDAFEMDWSAIEPLAGGGHSAGRPLPMVSVDPPCVGFWRPDWPEDQRRPSVANCADAGDIAAFEGEDDGVGLVREVLAGPDTWYLLWFGVAPTEVEAMVGTGDGDLQPLEPDGIHRLGRTVAIVVPTERGPLQLTWEVGGGARYRCDLGRPRADAGSCSPDGSG